MLLARLKLLNFLEHIKKRELVIPLMSDMEQQARDLD